MNCRKFLARLAGVLIGVLAAGGSGPAGATAVSEQPWHPLAAAYRSGLFFANLDPVPWGLIEQVWRQDPGLTALAGARESIAAAIAERDRPALHEVTTGAVAQTTIALLQRAAAELTAELTSGDPARRTIAEAQAIYRALGEAIDTHDPAGAREVGLAWLEVTTSLGSRPVDIGRFEAARTLIADYLTRAYLGERPAAGPMPAPIPATATDAKADVRPWLPPGSRLADQEPLPRLVLNFEQRGLDEADLPLVAYGDMLFDSPAIFGEPARSLGLSCATCHNRSDINRDLFIPGLSHRPGSVDVDTSFFNAIFNDRRFDPIDIPSLRGIRFTGPYGRDGRSASLRDFTRTVIVNEFGGVEPSQFMLDALLAYMREFDFLPNRRLAADGRLADGASAAERRGEVLFRQPFPAMNGQACASCHLPTANFRDGIAHDIGSVALAYPAARSGAMETPTLLGAAYTAPYFHDGGLPDLAGVVDWFDDRYGLGLDAGQRADLTAYLLAVGSADTPYQVFTATDTPFRLAWEELTTFAGTLDTLLPRQDRRHTLLLIDTLTAEFRADAGAMGNLSARPLLYRLNEALAEVGRLAAQERWQEAMAVWDEAKFLQADIDAEMY